jgi:hypothetical protein
LNSGHAIIKQWRHNGNTTLVTNDLIISGCRDPKE